MIRSVAALLIVCHQVLTYDLYSELVYLGGSCYPHDSCVPPRKDDEDHLWGNYTCECGMHCLRYGTCCVDSPYLDGGFTYQNHGVPECQKPLGFRDAVLMVSRCPGQMQYWHRQIRENCERLDHQDEDPLAMAPLTSLETQVTYKNYFCAMCNYDTRDFLLWNVGLEFRTRESVPGLSELTEDDILENLEYSDERKSWGVTKGDDFHKVKLKFILPSPLRKFVKKCYLNMLSGCGPDRAFNYEVRQKCLSYYAPIKLKDVRGYTRTYRNVHCSLCNNINISRSDGDMCKLDKHRWRKSQFSFALLLDINRSDGDLVGKRQACKDNEKWDPFFKKCRHLSCGLPGHVLKEGKCVQN